MAQGNYVTLPGGSGPNPFEGVSKSLSDLSKMYSDRALKEQEQARLDAATKESTRRWDIQNERQALLADRQTTEYNTQQEIQNWVKQFGETYDPNEVRKQKLKDVFNLTDEQIAEKQGEIDFNRIPLYQEDLDRYYSKMFTRKFGRAADLNAIRPYYSNISSLESLQADEDERAKALQTQSNKMLNYQLEAAKALQPGKSSKDSSSYATTTGKLPRSYPEILTAPMVKDFDESSSWYTLWFGDSEKQDAQGVANSTLSTLEKAGATPSEAMVVTKYVLDRLKTGPTLQEINDGSNNINALIRKGLEDYRKNEITYGSGDSNSQFLQEIASGKGLKGYSPTDIKAANRKKAQEYLDELYGRISKPTTSKPKVPSSQGTNPEQKILQNLGLSGTQNPTTQPYRDLYGNRVAALQAAEAAVNARQKTDLPIGAPKNAAPIVTTAPGTPLTQWLQQYRRSTYPERSQLPVPQRRRTIDPTGIELPSLGNLLDRALIQSYNYHAPNIDQLSQVPRQPGMTDAEYRQLIEALQKR